MTRLTPSDPFPEDLAALDLRQVEVLNSRVHRELDHEYIHDGEPALETEIRLEEINDELDRRDDSEHSQTSPEAQHQSRRLAESPAQRQAT